MTSTLQSEGEYIFATTHVGVITWLAQHCIVTYVLFLSFQC